MGADLISSRMRQRNDDVHGRAWFPASCQAQSTISDTGNNFTY
jgi:hypothetical protein